MKSLQERLERYTSFHQSKTNQLTHFISIPAILLGALFFLSWFSFSIAGHWNISFSWIAVAALLIYYFRLNVKLAALMTIILVILTLICSAIAYPRPTTGTFITFVVLFVGGWILQFIGHTFEKSRPALLANFSQILIGPLYLLCETLKMFNLGQYFDITQPKTETTPKNKVK